MLFKRRTNIFLFAAVVILFCLFPSNVKGIGSSDNIFYDALLKPMIRETFGKVKMNTNKHGFFHQYDFSTFSFSVPLIYRLVSVDNVLAFFQGLMNWRGHEKNLKSFFNGDKYGEYGSFFHKKMEYKFLEKYKNFTYSCSNSNCITFLYSWYLQLKKSNFFASYGLLYEYSNHIYSFDYYTFKYGSDVFKKMEEAYHYQYEGYYFCTVADGIIRKKNPVLEKKNTIPQGKIEPDLDSRYKSIVKKYVRKYINDGEGSLRQRIENFKDLYLALEGANREILENDLKCNYLDYNSRDNWDAANKYVSFCVNDFGVHIGISYLQNKIDPFYGFYFSLSFAAGVQYMTCVNGLKIEGKGGVIDYNNNAFEFLCNQRFYKNLFSFFIKFRLEAGYGLVRFFISFKSLDLFALLNGNSSYNEDMLQLADNAVVRLEEYNEACYKEELMPKVGFKEGCEKGFKRFLPKIIQFGFTLNL